MPDGSWIDYCDCGEYLGPIEHNARCPEPYCRKPHRGMYCTGVWSGSRARPWHHAWIGRNGFGTSECPEVCKCGRVRLDVYLKTVDFQDQSRDYWLGVFKDIPNKVYSTDIWETAESLVQKVKNARYHARKLYPIRGSDPLKDYGWFYGPWLQGKLDELVNGIDDSCTDNVRFAAMDRAGDMKRYRRKKQHGCCGYADQLIRHWLTGRKFLIGCNYGH